MVEKITEVREEMKRTGIWKNEFPGWVKDFTSNGQTNADDFCDWLQFVYLPNRLQDADCGKNHRETNLIVPQAVKYFGKDINKGKLLQLLIELDSI